MAIENGVMVGAPNSPAPANKTSRVIYSDDERADYERFGSAPEPESPSPNYDPRDEEKKPEPEEKPEEAKASTTTPAKG